MYKRKLIEDESIITLESQSTERYKLLKDIDSCLYFILRKKDNKTVLLGDKDEAEPFILYGLNDIDLKEDVRELFKQQDLKDKETK